MSQIDLFFEAPIEGEPEPDRCSKCGAAPDRLVAACNAPGCPIFGSEREKPELDTWTRETQRTYLTNIARRSQVYRERGRIGDDHALFAETHNARYVLLKLNGMAGQW